MNTRILLTLAALAKGSPRPIWTLLLTLLLTAAPAFAQRNKRNNPAPQRFDLPDRSVTVPEGVFLFQHLTVGPCLEQPGLLSYLQGTILNRTGRTWRNLIFDLPGHYDDGRTEPVTTIVLDRLLPSESRPISGFTCGLPVMASSGLASWDIILTAGSFDVQYTLVMTGPAVSSTLSFADSTIAVLFARAQKSMGILLENRTGSVIRLNWNEAVLVDWTGASHALLHNGVKYADRAGPKPPTVIPPGAHIEDALVSADSVSLGRTDWLVEDFLPEGRAAAGMKGRRLSFYLPLIVDGKTVDYTFTFEIANVT